VSEEESRVSCSRLCQGRLLNLSNPHIVTTGEAPHPLFAIREVFYSRPRDFSGV
jgi:hypothetical protein